MDGVRLEMDRKTWAEFKRQVRIASNELDVDGKTTNYGGILKQKMTAALTPLAAAWHRHLPGSLKYTVKRMPSSLSVRAGFKSAHGDQPFLPWLEFGGRVVWFRQPARGPFKRVPVYGFRMRKVMGLTIPRDPEGRYREPAVEEAMPRTVAKAGEAIQELLDTAFKS